MQILFDTQLSTLKELLVPLDWMPIVGREFVVLSSLLQMSSVKHLLYLLADCVWNMCIQMILYHCWLAD